MTTAHASNDLQRQNILSASIEKQLRVAVTHRLPGGWRTWKGRFDGAAERGRAVTLLLEACADDAGPMVRAGDTVGVSFRVGHKKCMFSSTVQEAQPAGPAFLMRVLWPTQMQQLQRRVYERVAPPPGNVVAVRFWRADTDHQPELRQVKHGQLEDLSAGGMRIKVAEGADLEMNIPYQCLFAPRTGAPPIMIEATPRHRGASERGRVSLGFQFVGLESSAEGQRVLDRLARVVSRYQRSQPRTSPRDMEEGE